MGRRARDCVAVQGRVQFRGGGCRRQGWASASATEWWAKWRGCSWACARASACERRNGQECYGYTWQIGLLPPPEEKSGVADSARLRGRDADSPELSAASVNSLGGVSGVPLRTWLPCGPGPGLSSGYTPCQGLDRADYPCTSPHTFMFLYFVSAIVNSALLLLVLILLVAILVKRN